MNPIDNANNDTPLVPLLTIAEVADILGVNVRHVRRLRQERRITVIKESHLIRFHPDHVQAWIDQNRKPALEKP